MVQAGPGMFSSSLENSSSWWFQPIQNVLYSQNWIIFPSMGENKNSLKPPPSHFRLHHGMMCFWNIWHKPFTMGRSERTIHHLCNSIHLVSAPNVGRLKVGVMSRIWNLDIWCQQFLLKGLMSQHCWYFSLFLFGFHYPRHLNISFWLQQQKVFPIQFTWTTNQPHMAQHTTCIPFGNQKR